jgi:hypothetical protein
MFRSQSVFIRKKKSPTFVDCSVVPGINHLKKRKLDDIGINNCLQLITAFKSGDPKISFVKENARIH